MTQHVECVACAGAGAESPACLWHLSSLYCVAGTAVLEEGAGCRVAAPRPGPPVLHKDDVVESTTSRPLHTVGTYCEAEPGNEGIS